MRIPTKNLLTHYIFNVATPRAKFIIRKMENSETLYWKHADFLQPIQNPDFSDTCKLKIIPAHIVTREIPYDTKSDVYTTHPAAYDSVYEPERTGFHEAVESGLKEEHHPDRIFVSFYLGLRHVFQWEGGIGPYTLPQNATLPIHFHSLPFALNNSDIMPVSLSLREDYHGMYDQFYQGNENIDTSKRCTFMFATDRILDPKDYFLIHGKLYYCKMLRYKIENCELSRIVEGEFFPVE